MRIMPIEASTPANACSSKALVFTGVAQRLPAFADPRKFKAAWRLAFCFAMERRTLSVDPQTFPCQQLWLTPNGTVWWHLDYLHNALFKKALERRRLGNPFLPN